MRAAEKKSTEECPVKMKLVAPPLYVLTTNVSLILPLRQAAGSLSQCGALWKGVAYLLSLRGQMLGC